MASIPGRSERLVSSANVMLLLVAVVAVALGGVFACADTALSNVSPVRSAELHEARRRGSASLARLHTDPAPYLSVVVLLRVLCEMVAAVLVAGVCVAQFGSRPVAFAVAVASMVVVSFVVIGVAPRTIGLQHAESAALALAPVVVRITRVLGPLPLLLIAIGNAVTPGKGLRSGPFASEAELRDLVDRAEASAVIEDRERLMIHSVFELGDTLAREVMVPRTDMVCIERSKTLRQCLSLALRSGFSRIPVIGESQDDVIGIVYLKDVARRTHDYHEAESTERVESVMRPAEFIPESKPVDALLREMQTQRNHIAVVVDEYGGTAGLITIEDILEEIVGDIADEYDPVAAALVEQLGQGTWRVSARLPVTDLEPLVERDLAEEDVDTVGGLFTKHLGKVPIRGSVVIINGVRLLVESTAGRRNRIGAIRVSVDQPESVWAAEPTTNGAAEVSGEEVPSRDAPATQPNSEGRGPA